MKKIKLLISLSLITLMSTVSIAQNMHNAKIEGIISVGSQDVAIINDLTTGDVYKSSIYTKDLLITNEEIQLEININGNEEQAKIIKPNLNANIIAFKQKSKLVIEVNALNPFDYMGKIHNIMVDNLLGNYSYSINTIEVESQVKNNTNLIFAKHYPDEPLIDLNALNQISNYEGNYSDLDFDNYEDILATIQATDPVKGAIIIDYIDRCSNINFSQSTEKIGNRLLTIENQFILHKGGDFDEFYLISAIFRYSLLKNMDDLDYPVIGAGGGNQLRIGRKWKIALADALGGTIGWFAGGIIGVLQGAAAGSTIANLLLN